MREVEVKIRLEDADEARHALGRAGASARSPRLFEDNLVYDDSEGSLAATRRLLRLRSSGGRHVLTFKAPVADEDPGSRYKEREEHEVELSDLEEARRIVEGLGYRLAFRYQKYRQSYEAGALRVEIDETPFDAFLELEGAREAIDALASALGYGPEDYIKATYRELFLEKTGAEGGDMVFPDDDT